MASSGSEPKISLKILVDVKSNKVVFAEAGKDFVDFIFTIMSLPLSTVTNLLKEKAGMVGGLGSLYKSIESLGVQYSEPDHNKDSVLIPRHRAIVPLLSLNDTVTKLYACEQHRHEVRDQPGSIFVLVPLLSSIVHILYSIKTRICERDSALYSQTMDNLEVKPMSISLIRSLVKDFDYLEEQQLQFGLQEGARTAESISGETSRANYRLPGKQEMNIPYDLLCYKVCCHHVLFL